MLSVLALITLLANIGIQISDYKIDTHTKTIYEKKLIFLKLSQDTIANQVNAMHYNLIAFDPIRFGSTLNESYDNYKKAIGRFEGNLAEANEVGDKIYELEKQDSIWKGIRSIFFMLQLGLIFISIIFYIKILMQIK